MSAPTEPSHFRWAGDDLLLDLHGKPGARRDAFGRLFDGRLTVQIAATAVDGKATARLIGFLAAEFGVAKSAVELIYGLASVKKRVRIREPRQLPQAAQVSARNS